LGGDLLEAGGDPLRYALNLGDELEEALGYLVDVKPLNEAPAWYEEGPGGGENPARPRGDS